MPTIPFSVHHRFVELHDHDLRERVRSAAAKSAGKPPSDMKDDADKKIRRVKTDGENQYYKIVAGVLADKKGMCVGTVVVGGMRLLVLEDSNTIYIGPSDHVRRAPRYSGGARETRRKARKSRSLKRRSRQSRRSTKKRD
jgi:hypothetical protein